MNESNVKEASRDENNGWHRVLARKAETAGFEAESVAEGLLWKRGGQPRVLFRSDLSPASDERPSAASVPMTVWVGSERDEAGRAFGHSDFFLSSDALKEGGAAEKGGTPVQGSDRRLTVAEAVHFPSPAGDQCILAFDAPELARALRPGQFLNVALARSRAASPQYRVLDDPSDLLTDEAWGPEAHHLARVPLSMLRVYRENVPLPSGVGPLPPDLAYRLRPAGANRVSVAVRVVGHGTRALYHTQTGDALQVLGPLGLPERVPEGVRRVTLLAGGVGFAPLYALAEQCHWRNIPTTFLAGARVREHLFPWPNDPKRYVAPEFQGLDLELKTVNEAESGRFATELLEEHLHSAEGRDTDLVYVCGPWPMMARASAICAAAGVACRVFLEKRMECGVGVCMSCVCRYRKDDGEWANARVCREGTVFDAARIQW